MIDKRIYGSFFNPSVSEINLPQNATVKTEKTNNLSVSVDGVKIPTVSLDRKAKSSLILSLFSIFLFPVLPLSVVAVVSGINSIKSPQKRICALFGIIFGIVSFIMFISVCIITVLFRKEIFSSEIYMSFSDFLVKCFGNISRFIYGIFNGGN